MRIINYIKLHYQAKKEKKSNKEKIKTGKPSKYDALMDTCVCFDAEKLVPLLFWGY